MTALHIQGDFTSSLARIERKSGRTPSRFQQDIYRWLAEGEGHGIVNAVAGSGKTTTLMEALEFIPSNKKVLMVAFNKHIAEELTSRGLPANCTAQTLHSVGYAALRAGERKRYIKVDPQKVKRLFMTQMAFDQLNADERKEFWALCNPLCRMVSLFKSFGLGFGGKAYPSKEQIFELAGKYDIDLPGESLMEKFLQQLEYVYLLSLATFTSVDYDDMLAAPVAQGHSFKTYDYVFVDESQDLNPIQITIVRKLLKQGGRAIFVGDRHQAIYGFRGADPEAMNTVVDLFDAHEMPLSISWRCPKSVIAAAQVIVPHIEASPRAIEGVERRIKKEAFFGEVASGDYVLCRVTADLVAGCLRLIREGRKAMVKGRDIGKGLSGLLSMIKQSGRSGAIWEQIDAYGLEEGEKMKGGYREAQLLNFTDKIDTLKVLAEGLDSYADVEARIDKIFQDTDAGIIFCTIHKAKGLESDNVYVLRPEILPHPLARQAWQIEQESNLKYVAITRARRELIWVDEDK